MKTPRILAISTAALLAAAALYTWFAASWHVWSRSSRPLQMAPSTAFVVLLLCVSHVVGVASRGQPSKVRSTLALTCVVAALVQCIARLAGLAIGETWELAVWSGAVDDEVNSAFAVMSPLAAFILLLLGFSLALGQNGRSDASPRLADYAGSLNLVAFVIVVANLVGEVLESRIPGSGHSSQVAFLTGWCLLCLATTNLFSLGPSAFPMRLFVGENTSARLMRAFFPLVIVAVVAEDSVFIAMDFTTFQNPTLVKIMTMSVLLGMAYLLIMRVAEKTASAIDAVTAERDATNSALLKTESRFRAFMDRAPWVTFIKSRDGKLLYVNERFSEFQFLPRQPLGNVVANADSHGAQITADHDRAVIDEGKAIGSEVPFKAEDGSVVYWKVVKFPLDEDGVRLIGGVAIDVTAQRAAEANRTRLERTLHEQAKLATLGEMAGTIAHEINNPIAIISGKSRQIQDDLVELKIPKASAIAAEIVTIEKMCKRIVAIVNGLKSVARGSAFDPPVSQDVAMLIRETLALADAQLRFSNVAVKVDVPSTNLNLSCRPGEISQVLLNLLSNALDAVKDLPQRWVEIAAREECDTVFITVTDSGSGVPAGVQDKLMTPFFTTKPVGKGTGLGLSISRGIVNRHGGELSLDPKFANTRFVVKLPKAGREMPPRAELGLERKAT